MKNKIDTLLAMVDNYPQGLKEDSHSVDFLSTTDLGGTNKGMDIIGYTINKLSLLPEKELFKYIGDKLNIVEKVQSFYNKYEPVLNLKLQQCKKELDTVVDGGLLFKEFYLYKGIPDKDTRIIKPEIANVAIEDYYTTNEICVVTPIRIEKLGRIKVYYKSKIAILSKDNIVKIVKEDSL